MQGPRIQCANKSLKYIRQGSAIGTSDRPESAIDADNQESAENEGWSVLHRAKESKEDKADLFPFKIQIKYFQVVEGSTEYVVFLADIWFKSIVCIQEPSGRDAEGR